jgi:hypothetical protein
MSLETWFANGWLVRHSASPRELEEMLDAAARDLADATKDVSAPWRFAIAYNAALRLCTVVLQAAGYRATRGHNRFSVPAPLLRRERREGERAY